ncbi:MAG: hypothetical protein DRI90_05160 [Deltaproteobacteria bacterium]|nr:MAG: hypothetical protein DRI90_05160 [Deltaproteobacteria bacterium]
MGSIQLQLRLGGRSTWPPWPPAPPWPALPPLPPPPPPAPPLVAPLPPSPPSTSSKLPSTARHDPSANPVTATSATGTVHLKPTCLVMFLPASVLPGKSLHPASPPAAAF